MALSVLRASVRGRRGKPGPRVPACRGSAYPVPPAAYPSDSVAAIASNAAWLMAILIIGQTAGRRGKAESAFMVSLRSTCAKAHRGRKAPAPK